MRAIALAGTILKGRYCIVEQIGGGGQGHLYLARDLELGTYWAVKEIPITQKKEAKLLRLLHHPAMPGMIDYLEKDEFCYLIMEYIRGENLGELLKKGKRFSVEEVIRMGICTAGVLEYLHGRRPAIIYGDMKPENLVLDETGHLYLVDFGSAGIRYEENARITTGTRGFAAPEQYQGRSDVRSDIYGFGQTFLTVFQKCRKREAAGYAALLWIFLKCRRKNPDRRYQNMEQILRALKKVQKNSINVLQAVQVAVLTFVLLLAAALLIFREPKPDFHAALTEVTDYYYGEDFLKTKAGGEEWKKLLYSVENHLKKLLTEYLQEEEQRKLLLLLAENCELAGEEEEASQYYRQLLLEHPGYRAGYGEYGMFLFRIGREEEAKRLWEDYKDRREHGMLDHTEGPALKKWEEQNDGKG